MIYQKPFDVYKIINTIHEIQTNNICNSIDKKLDSIFKKLNFDHYTKATKLLKSAVLIAYNEPDLKLEQIMKKVQIQNNEKNANTVRSLIDKQLNNMYSYKNNLDTFVNTFPSFCGDKPTTKTFMNVVLNYL